MSEPTSARREGLARQIDMTQPIVLAGGACRRFGRDKLRECVSHIQSACNASELEWLIDVPIAALRSVFGPRVAIVGRCAPEVASRGDLAWPDDPALGDPPTGPAAGVLTALKRSGRDVFVLAGDMPAITPATILRVLESASGNPEAWAVLGRSLRGIEPCLGLYRQPMSEVLRGRLAAAPPRRSLHDAAPTDRLVTVLIDDAAARNINAPGDLGATAPP